MRVRVCVVLALALGSLARRRACCFISQHYLCIMICADTVGFVFVVKSAWGHSYFRECICAAFAGDCAVMACAPPPKKTLGEFIMLYVMWCRRIADSITFI